MTQENWSDLHDDYSTRDWAMKPSLFAETVKDYLSTDGALLELGAGLGQDSTYFCALGYNVTATDINLDKLLELDNDKLNIVTVDLRRPLPFKEDSFDVVYAHLSLHYFDMRTTKKIFDEIYRVLKKDGVLAFFTNALTDPEYGTGHRIEADYFEINGVKKRYLTVDTAMQFAHAFKPLLVDDNGETYKDSDKGVHHLIRFVGRKP